MTPQKLRAQALAANNTASLPGTPEEVCTRADNALRELVDVVNKETTLLRCGKFDEAAPCAAKKAELAQTYVGLARAIQSNAADLKANAPELLAAFQHNQTALTTQIAENLRVLATAKTLSEDIIQDVAVRTGQPAQMSAYGASGRGTDTDTVSIKGVAVNTTY